MAHEPDAELAQGEAVAHRDRARADETFPAFAQLQPFDRPAGRIRTIEHPDRLAVFRGGFQHVKKSGDEGVDATADVLQIDEQHVEVREHLLRGTAHLAIETEYGNPMDRIAKVLRLDHVVLLVTAQPVLRTERGGDVEPADRAQRIERMLEIGGHRRGMREQRDASAFELLQEFVIA